MPAQKQWIFTIGRVVLYTDLRCCFGCKAAPVSSFENCKSSIINRMTAIPISCDNTTFSFSTKTLIKVEHTGSRHAITAARDAVVLERPTVYSIYGTTVDITAIASIYTNTLGEENITAAAFCGFIVKIEAIPAKIQAYAVRVVLLYFLRTALPIILYAP